MEGNDGFTANLYKGRKKIAELLEAANGGELIIYWEDSTAPKVAGNVMNAFDKIHQRAMTPCEAELAAYLIEIKGSDPVINADADMVIWLVNLTQYTDLVKVTKRELKSALFYDPETHDVIAFKAPYDGKFKAILDDVISRDHPGYESVNNLTIEDATFVLNYDFFENREAAHQAIIDSHTDAAAMAIPKF